MSSADLGVTVPGLTKIEWTGLKEKSKLGEGSFEEVYSARINDKLVVVKKLRRQKKQKREIYLRKKCKF